MNARILEPEPHGVLISGRRLPAGDVDGIAGGSKGRDELAERGIEIRGHRHERQPVVDARIREQHARSAGPGDDHHVVALGGRQHLDTTGEVQQIAQRPRTDHSRLSEHVVVDLVVAGERAGVRARRPCPHGGAAGLQHHDRLFLRDPAGDLGERPPVLQILQVLADDLSVVVLLEEGEQIVLVDVGLVAEAHDGRHPHLRRA